MRAKQAGSPYEVLWHPAADAKHAAIADPAERAAMKLR